MGREQWLKLPPAIRLLLVVGGLLLAFGLLSGPFPTTIDMVLALLVLALGLAYAWWEWSLIQAQKVELEAQLRRERRDWQRGLPAHLRAADQSPGPDAPAPQQPDKNPPVRPDEGPAP